MAGLIRMLFGMILSTLAARMVDRMMSPKQKVTSRTEDNPKVTPTLDLKPCPVCGIYTAQPATHCPR